jgi:hypothetical protein
MGNGIKINRPGATSNASRNRRGSTHHSRKSSNIPKTKRTSSFQSGNGNNNIRVLNVKTS